MSIDSSLNLAAVGGVNRLSRIFDTDTNKLVGSTKSETMPISSVVFHDSRFLLTAGTDNLKVWDTNNDILMTDSI